jgi:hypothetical protein
MADPLPVDPTSPAADDRHRRKPAPVHNPVQVPAPERDPAALAPVFVLAPARSHSSVVTTAIGQHPQLHAFPELGLYRRDTVGPILFDPPGWKGIPNAARLGGLLRALAQHNHGDQDHDAILEAYHWLRCRRAWSGAHVYDHLLSRVAPKIGVEKTPDNSNTDQSLARLATAYPRARFLHLTRHPVTTQLSMNEAWSRLPYWNVPPGLFRQFCMAAWFFHHDRILRFTSTLMLGQTMRVRAEDILNHPRREMAAICRWLDLDSGREAVTAMCHPERSPFASIGPQDARFGNDPNFLRSPRMRRVEIPPSVDVPDDWLVDPWLLTATIELAHRLGYRHGDP